MGKVKIWKNLKANKSQQFMRSCPFIVIRDLYNLRCHCLNIEISKLHLPMQLSNSAQDF